MKRNVTTGAYIASTATPDKNSLTTSNIQDQSNYSVSSDGFSAGGATAGATGSGTGPASVPGAGGITPMMSQSASGSQSATTQSGISAGTLTITDQANQTQALSSINRDTTNLNGAVSSTPNVQNLLNQQADLMNAAQAAGQVVAQTIGAYADTKHQEALDSGDTAAAAAWAEGGSSRALLQAVGGALMGGLGGGSALSAVGGGVGAGAASYLAGQLNSLEKGVTSETRSSLLGNIAGNIVAGVGGTLIGGSAGAAMASNVELYNQSWDPAKELTGDTSSSNSSLSGAACGFNGSCSAQQTQIINQVGETVGSVAVATIGPEAVFATGVATLVDYASHGVGYLLGGSDLPDLNDSYQSGLAAGLLSPVSIGSEAMSEMTIAQKATALSYNGALAGVGALATSDPTQNSTAAVSAGVATGLSIVGGTFEFFSPAMGKYINQFIQGMAAPIQNFLNSNSSKSK